MQGHLTSITDEDKRHTCCVETSNGNSKVNVILAICSMLTTRISTNLMYDAYCFVVAQRTFGKPLTLATSLIGPYASLGKPVL